MDVSSASAREKGRRLDSLLKELVSTSDNMRLAVLCTLPEEIILSFLQLACYDFWSIVKVSLVCKKFRHIKLSSSKLWAKCLLTLNTSPHVIDMVASRSGTSGLTVILRSSQFYEKDWVNRLTKLFEHNEK